MIISYTDRREAQHLDRLFSGFHRASVLWISVYRLSLLLSGRKDDEAVVQSPVALGIQLRTGPLLV